MLASIKSLSLLLMAVMIAVSMTTNLAVQAAPNEHASDNAKNKHSDDTEDETAQAEPEDNTANDNGNADNVRGTNGNAGAGGNGDTQPDRVGNHDDAQQTSGEGANKGGTVTDDTLCDITDNPDCSTTVKANCFGKVISERAQDHKEDPDEGTLGSHSRDPVPEIPGNEVPRQGIGNQDQGHPAAHGAFNSQFEDEDEENVVENC